MNYFYILPFKKSCWQLEIPKTVLPCNIHEHIRYLQRNRQDKDLRLYLHLLKDVFCWVKWHKNIDTL